MLLCWLATAAARSPSSGSCLLSHPVRPFLGPLCDPATQHVTPRLSKLPGLRHATYQMKELLDNGVVGWGFYQCLIIAFVEYEHHRSYCCHVNVSNYSFWVAKISISQGRIGEFPNLDFKVWPLDELKKASPARFTCQWLSLPVKINKSHCKFKNS